jgi:arsenate reductase
MPDVKSTMMTVYEKPTCSTCRNLVALLQEKGVPFERLNYIIDPIPRARLAEIVAMTGGRPHDLVRTREDAFRTLGRDLDGMSDDEVLDLLAVEPTLVQRPIVVAGNRAVVARPVTRVLELILTDHPSERRR